MELPTQPKVQDFVDDEDDLRVTAYHEALAAWERVCNAIILRTEPQKPPTAELSNDAIEAMNAGDWQRATNLLIWKIDALYKERRSGRSTSSAKDWEFFCEHANENPNVCPCPTTCGCRQAHCKDKSL